MSGNPTGKNGMNVPIAVLARSMVPAAIKRLKKIIEDDNASSAAHIGAVGHVLDRAYGKPPSFNTSDTEAFRKAVDLSDDELATIAAQHLKLVVNNK